MIEKKILDKYNDSFKKYGIDDRRSLLWTKDKQTMRFNVLLNGIAKVSNMTILDYGCGFADLKSFLIQNFYRVDYNGCDINENFIKVAKEKYPNENIFHINSIDDVKDRYDIVLVSGTFNVIPCQNEESMKEYIFSHIEKLFKQTNYMLTMNFLSHLTDKEYRYDEHFYIEPFEIYNFAIKNLTKRVIIDASSLPFEITIKLFKNENIQKDYTIYEEI